MLWTAKLCRKTPVCVVAGVHKTSEQRYASLGQRCGTQSPTVSKEEFLYAKDPNQQQRWRRKILRAVFRCLVPEPITDDGECSGIENPTNKLFYGGLKLSLSRVLEGGSLLTAAYGYSGSGKTYGYFNDKAGDLGAVFRFFEENTDNVQQVEVRRASSARRQGISVRVCRT